MRTTIVQQDGITQVVLTPETDIERLALNLVNHDGIETVVKVGNFSECHGNWIRQYPFDVFDYDEKDKIDSVMLVLRKK